MSLPTLDAHPTDPSSSPDAAPVNPDAAPPVTLLGRTTPEIAEWITGIGEPAYRGNQIAHWIYRRAARSFGEMTELPSALRDHLSTLAVVGRGAVALNQEASDGTVKSLLCFSDGETVETVYLPWRKWDSACISTQAGCPAACAFCATGAMGFRRNLTAAEMLDQVLLAGDHSALRHAGDRGRLTHLVFMGMGEPLLNYGPTLQAVRILNREIGVGMRGITLSTVGIVPAIRRLARERLQLTLSVSLHAPNQELRERIVPVAKTWPLGELIDACEEYAGITRRRVTYEYVLLAGVNDRPAHARELADLLKGSLAHVNLIPFNPGPTLSEYRTPSEHEMRGYAEILQQGGVRTTLRTPRGRDIEAACGQLRKMLEKSDRGLIRIATGPSLRSAPPTP